MDHLLRVENIAFKMELEIVDQDPETAERMRSAFLQQAALMRANGEEDRASYWDGKAQDIADALRAKKARELEP
ncbi:hypothetical protein AMST5_03617 [freshwater sediment metagenome]|uniref:Uncharacterized protein n=1 Tax=freshwater sediment metagenome TaxID=556182 RepID=A0AA48M2A4_9ZZZZ